MAEARVMKPAERHDFFRRMREINPHPKSDLEYRSASAEDQQRRGRLKDDARGLETVWAEFMLEPAPGTTPAMEAVPGAPQAGLYQCRGGTAGNFKIEFRSGSAYANDFAREGQRTWFNRLAGRHTVTGLYSQDNQRTAHQLC